MKNKKTVIVTILILLIGLSSVLLFKNYFQTSKTALQPVKPGNSLTNLNGPTETDKKDVDINKTMLPNTAAPAPTPDTAVIPTIVDVGYYDSNVEARAYVPGIIESGGTCTYTFSSGVKTVIKTTTGVQDAQYTRCSNLVTSASEFTSGNWSLVVSYRDKTVSGSSTAKAFVINK